MAEYNEKLLDLMCRKVAELQKENLQLKTQLQQINKPHGSRNK